MALNDTAMGVAAAALKTAMLYAQLHTAAAGGSGVSNVASSARRPITWGSTTANGDFGLSGQLDFTGGAANGPVYSVTLWSASTSGTFYGEFILGGDTAFNAAGLYSVTSINLDGSAS